MAVAHQKVWPSYVPTHSADLFLTWMASYLLVCHRTLSTISFHLLWSTMLWTQQPWECWEIVNSDLLALLGAGELPMSGSNRSHLRLKVSRPRLRHLHTILLICISRAWISIFQNVANLKYFIMRRTKKIIILTKATASPKNRRALPRPSNLRLQRHLFPRRIVLCLMLIRRMNTFLHPWTVRTREKFSRSILVCLHARRRPISHSWIFEAHSVSQIEVLFSYQTWVGLRSRDLITVTRSLAVGS